MGHSTEVEHSCFSPNSPRFDSWHSQELFLTNYIWRIIRSWCCRIESTALLRVWKAWICWLNHLVLISGWQVATKSRLNYAKPSFLNLLVCMNNCRWVATHKQQQTPLLTWLAFFFHRKYSSIWAEFLPQILFLCSVFGYLSLLMLIKVWKPTSADNFPAKKIHFWDAWMPWIGFPTVEKMRMNRSWAGQLYPWDRKSQFLSEQRLN